MEKPTVFISYSHQDEVWKDRLRLHLEALENLDRLVIWDDRKIDGGEKWYPEIRSAIERAAVGVCLVSINYLASKFCTKEEVPYLLEQEGLLFLPVLIKPCDWEIHYWLSETQMLPRDGKSVAVDFRDLEDVAFTEVAKRIRTYLEDRAPLPPTTAPSWEAPPRHFIDIRRLPETGHSTTPLFGRKKELKLLNDAWESGTTNVVSLVAYGGVGKSALVNKWLEGLKRDNYRGAERVFAWSFYSQGTRERITSADYFIREALAFFGDPTPDEGSPWDKGERLAKLVGQHRTLLVLDGMEPLQSGQQVEYGKVKDPALAMLLRKLAKANAGLCVITTRVSVTDLAEMDTVEEEDLERISPEAGRALLRIGGVIAADDELEALARDFGPHALALNLLGSYLHNHPAHGLKAAKTIPGLETLSEAQGRHAWRVLAAFETLLGESEVELLRVLGLFDRPAKAAEVTAVRSEPSVEGLTEHLVGLGDKAWNTLITRLRDLRLVAKHSSHAPDSLDAHPLVREYFGQQLQEQFPEAWREGHNRLYEHLKETTKEYPDTLDKMVPLYQAVAHGCRAGWQTEVLNELFLRRMNRGVMFVVKKLGAVGSTLAALSDFYDSTWDKPTSTLSDSDKGYLLNATGYLLRGLGRLEEAIPLERMSMEIDIAGQVWRDAAVSANNLSEMSLILGKVNEALKYAEESLVLVEKSGDPYQRVGYRVNLANVLHQEGRLPESEAEFQSAEETSLKALGRLLKGIDSFLYCDLVLGQVEQRIWPVPLHGEIENLKQVCQEVKNRGEKLFEWRSSSDSLLDIALDHLTLGRAHLLVAQLEDRSDFTQAEEHLKEAAEGLWKAERQDELPRALLARAALCRAQKKYDRAWVDVEESLEIAEQGSMRLFRADGLLESARLHYEQEDYGQVRACLAEAKAMIEEMGYHRRDREVVVLERVLGEEG